VDTRSLPSGIDTIAPDGSEVRLLCSGTRGSMAHFRLPAGQVSAAVVHRTVEELWFFVSGHGAMWRRLGDAESVVAVVAGVSVHIPVGASFQFRADESAPLEAVAVTMPPWPGSDEARVVSGPWTPSVTR
jgi:mannose-6-phosphate isomerase-like protein (cupin superfamily)